MSAATAIAIGGIGASIAGGAIASHGANKAADTQAQAAQSAAQLQKQSADDALAFQKQQYSDTQKNQAPFLQAGQGAIGQLSDLMKPGGDLTKQFQAPTDVTQQNDPGYQFRLAEGQKALERSAAARGGLLSGGTAKAAQRYGQDYASNEYGNVYNRAFNEFQTNQANQYNRLAGIAGTGQTAANTLGTLGQSSANQVGNILQYSGQQQGNAAENAGAARASGYIGSANAWSGVPGAIANNASSLAGLFYPKKSSTPFGTYTGVD